MKREQKKIKRNLACQLGFTMLEAMITASLFTTVMLGVYAVLDSSNVIFRTNHFYSQLNQNAMQSLRSITREINQTSPLVSPARLVMTTNGSGAGLDSVRFQIPVDTNGDGDSWDWGVSGYDTYGNPVSWNNADAIVVPNVEWGAYPVLGDLSNGILDSWVRYRVANGQLIREVIDSAGNLEPNTNAQILANGVTGFTVARDAGNFNRINVTLTLTQSDLTGQSGQQRDLTTTFRSMSYLRNTDN